MYNTISCMYFSCLQLWVFMNIWRLFKMFDRSVEWCSSGHPVLLTTYVPVNSFYRYIWLCEFQLNKVHCRDSTQPSKLVIVLINSMSHSLLLMVLLLKNSKKTLEGVFTLLSWFNSNMHFEQLFECDSER